MRCGRKATERPTAAAKMQSLSMGKLEKTAIFSCFWRAEKERRERREKERKKRRRKEGKKRRKEGQERKREEEKKEEGKGRKKDKKRSVWRFKCSV
jgi:hypothetical protein